MIFGSHLGDPDLEQGNYFGMFPLNGHITWKISFVISTKKVGSSEQKKQKQLQLVRNFADFASHALSADQVFRIVVILQEF